MWGKATGLLIQGISIARWPCADPEKKEGLKDVEFLIPAFRNGWYGWEQGCGGVGGCGQGMAYNARI